MPENKSRERIQKLKAEKDCIAEQLERLENRKRRYDREIKAMEHAEKELVRKRRSHRIFTRGAMLEGFLQEPLLLSDEQVYTFLKIVFHRADVDALLKKIIGESRGKADGAAQERGDDG